MNSPLQNLMSTLLGNWKNIERDTLAHFGEGKSTAFLELYDDVLEIGNAIQNQSDGADTLANLTYFELMGLTKELPWFQVFFLCGNYRMVMSQLRFNWERIFRARYADSYGKAHPNATDAPGPSLDDKAEWLKQRENGLNWRNPISPTLIDLFPEKTAREIDSYFKPIWDRLNGCVHPSGDWRDRMVGGDGFSHVLDGFDQALAEETLRDAADVFTVIFLAVISLFPASVECLLEKPRVFRACPQIREVLK